MIIRFVDKDFYKSEVLEFKDFEQFIESQKLKEYEYFLSNKNCVIPTSIVQDNIDILRLLFKRQITMFYQPIFSNKTGFVYGFEALLRVKYENSYICPKSIFDITKKIGLEKYVDIICREQAVAQYKQIKSKLFINVNADSFNGELYKKGNTINLILNSGLEPSCIVLEITESEKADINAVKDAIEYYTSLGFSIALDDFGTGYNSLEMISRVQPQYIKLPMELINGISRSKLKWQIVRSVMDMAIKNGIKTIAEGIENKDDLETVIGLNIDYSQGFLLGKPSEDQSIPKDGIMTLRSVINSIKLNSIKDRYKIDIKDLESIDVFNNLSTKEFLDLAKQTKAQWIYLKDKDILINETCIKSILKATQENLFYYKDIDYLFSHIDCHYLNNLTLDIYDNLLHAYYMIAEQKVKLFIVKNQENIIGVLRREAILERLFDTFYKMTLYTNPLTGLPGNILIEKEIEDLLGQKIEAYVVYIDISNFKPFNDAYGFLAGDMMIKKVAEVLQMFSNDYDSFVGHIGGDDFVVIFKHLEEPEKTIGNLYTVITKSLESFYSDEDLKNGYFVSKDREGNIKQFPIAKITLGAVYIPHYDNSKDISRKAAELKKESKRYMQPVIEPKQTLMVHNMTLYDDD